METLERWGLVTREGSTRSRKFVLGPTPNVLFCEDVVSGMYGDQVLESVKAGTITAGISVIEGQGNSVCDYAVQQLLGVYGVETFVTYALPEPSTKTGTGSVVLPDYRNLCFGVVVSVYTYSNYVQITEGQISQDATVYTYHSVLPPGLQADKRVSTPKQRAARDRTYDLPNSSFAFLRWPDAKIREVDPHYETVLEVITYWNEQFKHNIKYYRKLYCIIRTLLVEQEMSVDQVRTAIRAARLDKYWGENASLSSFADNPSLVRKLASKSTHDRYGRNMDVHPKGEVIAVEF
jgi:hypothetical protein